MCEDGIEPIYLVDSKINTDEEFRVDYGSDVYLNSGQFTISIGQHEILINLENKSSYHGVSFIASKDNLTDDKLLKPKMITTGKATK
jgi:hypothetical protein